MLRAIVRRKAKEPVDLTPSYEPDVDLVETRDYIRIVADMPGFDRDNIDVLVGDDGIIIRGERKLEDIYTRAETFRLMERKMGKIIRQIPLTHSVRTDDIELFFEEGVLVIHLPKEFATH